MRTCHVCQGDIDDDALRSGTCPHCDAVIQKVAKRTMRLPEGLSPDATIDLTSSPGEEIVLEFDSLSDQENASQDSLRESAATTDNIDLDQLQSLELTQNDPAVG